MRLLFILLPFLLLTACGGGDVKTMSKADSANLLMTEAGKLVRQGMEERKNQKEDSLSDDSRSVLLFGDARDLYLKALQLDPQNFKTYSYIGTTYYFSGKFRESVPYYKKALQLNPGYKEAWFNLGMVYDQLKLQDSAINAFSECIRADSSYVPAYAQLSRLTMLKELKADHAMEILQLAAKHKPDSDVPWNEMSAIYFRMQDTANAISALETAAKLRPENTTRLYNLSLYFRQHNDSTKYNYYLHRLEEMKRKGMK